MRVVRVLENNDLAGLEPPPTGSVRCGQEVAWRSGPVLSAGRLRGHSADGRITVELDAHGGGTTTLPSWDSVRPVGAPPISNHAWEALADTAVFAEPEPRATAAFQGLCGTPLPGGACLNDLVDELWFRGFESAIGCGTVRDLLLGSVPSAADLMTTMPLGRVRSVARDLFPPDVTWGSSLVHLSDDYAGAVPMLRIGSLEALDGFSITVRNPSIQDQHHDPLFGENWVADASARDFTCNSVLYDSRHNLLIDPLACGLSDIEQMTLRPASGPSQMALFDGWRVVRAARFSYRGFAPHEDLLEVLRPGAETGLRSLGKRALQLAVQMEILCPVPEAEWDDALFALRETLKTLNVESIYDDYIHDERDAIIVGASDGLAR